MITIDEKEYRNLQEQVGYLTEQLTQIKQSLGNALPDPIEGPKGDTGDTGPTGLQGRTPKIGFGFGPLPTDASYEDGDLYIVRGNNTQYGLNKGDLYKKENNVWVLKLNLVGPQGPIGINGTEVIANPEQSATGGNLEKVYIDGVVYTVSYVEPNVGSGVDTLGLTDVQINGTTYFVGGSWAKYLSPYLYEDNEEVHCDTNFVLDEGMTISMNGQNRFIEGSLITEEITGVTFTYAKWSLSGTHLLIVLCGEIEAGTTLSTAYWATTNNLPDFIKNKIVGVFATNYIEIKDTYAYYDTWDSISIQNALVKHTNGLRIQQIAGSTANDFAYFRIQYDLLIDMDN